MDFGAANGGGPMFDLETMPSGCSSNPNPDRVIGIDITFTCPGTDPIRRSFLRSEWKAVHLGREPADISGVANAFMRTDVVPPVMSRKHAEIMFDSETPQVMDIGSYHGTYFRESGQRLEVHRPYLLTDGLVLEFGKSVTKDDKAHEPLLATIKFIHESDRDRGRFLVTGREHASSASLFPTLSPPRRYSVPSDSDDEDESVSDGEDDDASSRSDVFEYTPQPTHIDLTAMSDDGKSSVDGDGDGIECVGFGFSRSGYEEESISSSDMSESEYEEDVGKVITPPSGGVSGAGAPGPSSSTHGLITPPVELVAPAPISLPRLPRIEAALSGLHDYHEIGFYPLALPDFGSRVPMEDHSRTSGSGLEWYIPSNEQVHQGPSQVQHGPSPVQHGPSPIQQESSQVRQEPEVTHVNAPQHEVVQASAMSEEVRALKVELAVAQDEITELKRSLAEKEKHDQDGDVRIVEAPAVAEEATETPAVDDLPTIITNIENMMSQLTMVGDDELREHRGVVLHLLAHLSSERRALWHRVGDVAMSGAIGNKRKRAEEEEDEPRRAQSPLPAPMAALIEPVPTPVPAPTLAPGPPAKRLRITPAVSAIAGGAAVWGALALGYL